MIDIALAVIATIVAAMRLAGFKGAIFKACAHIFAGWLFGAWFANREMSHYLYFAIMLTVVEIVAFVASRVIGN